jgi:N-acetylneuraminate lyase
MTVFEGILPAVVTPLDAGLQLDKGAFERLLAALHGAGVHGVYVCGQTGEGLLQGVEQRKQVAEIAVRCSPPGKAVIAHVGARELDDAIDLAKHAERIGVHAISSLPPLGDRSSEQIHAYYRTLAGACGLPFLLYYFPDLCPAIKNPDQLLELLALPNVIGLKFTDYNLYQLWQLRQRGLVVFNGRDEVLAAGALMGASGGIGSFYNLVPELFLRVWEAGRQDRWAEARCAQSQINELIGITLRFPVFPAIKRMLAWSGLDCGGCHAQYRALTAEEERELRRLLSQSSLAKTAFAGLRIA